MKQVLSLLCVLVVASVHPIVAKPSSEQPINAVVGDASLKRIFGFVPTHLDEQLRIKTHLAYIEQLLRQKDVTHLSPMCRNKRLYLLDKLHEYWVEGRFPQNFDFLMERRPCFIDKLGSICAVGYLIEQDIGRDMAEFINIRHKYDYILSINEPELLNWINQSGLTVEECAMIQPTYTPIDPNMRISLIPNGFNATTTNNYIAPYDMTIYATGLTHDSIRVEIALAPVGKDRIKQVSISSSPLLPSTIVVAMNGLGYNGSNGYPFYVHLPVQIRDLKRGVISSDEYFHYYFGIIPTGVENEFTHEWSSYPNPFTDKLQIQFGAVLEPIQVNMYNIQGSRVFQNVHDTQDNLNLDGSNLSKGIYFLEMKSTKRRLIRKVVKY